MTKNTRASGNSFPSRARALRAFAGAALLALAGGGCAQIDHVKVEGWPRLEIVENHVSHREMRDHCARYVPVGQFAEGCVEFNLDAGRCDIWLSADFPPAPYVVEHERLHCAGFDHVGENNMANALESYLASRRLASRSRPIAQ